MSTVNEYHAYARDCFRWAARARTEEQRERLLNLARHWRQAALELEGVSIASAPTAAGVWVDPNSEAYAHDEDATRIG